ncbi:hypothetical protein EYC98_18660 [Halieaceae bacterium IMCC14734]|uniref:Uncharacterized protein n=1 Tax=Candidatus Litorirhabdus singularis TaxID=2518993 RepID=A0ABT3TKP8_9GAMM|nr:hypothetical protein [Candidatus Litorirhabdus singularis]MCX2982888.1 hypothetical protein [Candidatus Litorirhabdus singularis]
MIQLFCGNPDVSWSNLYSILHLTKMNVQNASYGRAAKLVNVYLKTMVVLIDPSGEPAKLIYPPIDRILLQSLAAKSDADEETKKFFRRIKWTQLDEPEYFEVVGILRTLNGDRPFWIIEEHWNVTN